MKNLEVLGVSEMDAGEIKNENGGGWIADAVEWLICDCNWDYPAAAYHSAMMQRGV